MLRFAAGMSIPAGPRTIAIDRSNQSNESRQAATWPSRMTNRRSTQRGGPEAADRDLVGAVGQYDFAVGREVVHADREVQAGRLDKGAEHEVESAPTADRRQRHLEIDQVLGHQREGGVQIRPFQGLQETRDGIDVKRLGGR